MSDGKVDVLAIGPHPDDVELGCGGTLALLAKRGRRVAIAHLTRGEAGTRGSEAERRREAERAAATLGAVELAILDCGDGGLRTGPDEEDAVIALIRRLQPELVLGPPAVDRHPDHGRACLLVEDACFYAGLAARGEGAPHRPAAVWSYMGHDSFEPDLVVDVAEVWEAKIAALDCYESQLHQLGADRREPATKVASPEFRLAIEGRARHFGLLIGAARGEPFASRLPLAVRDPLELMPGGVR